MKRIILISLVLLLLILGFFGYQKYNDVFSPNVPSNLEESFIRIPTGSEYEDVVKLLSENNFLLDENAFKETAKLMKFDQRSMRAGRYEIKEGWSSRDLIKHLRTGKQAPVKLVLTSQRLLENVAAKAANFIEADSVELLSYFMNDKNLKELGYTEETLMSLFIPNTYEFFWNTNAEGFVKRMVKEHKKFWEKDNRLQKAKALDMTPKEVYTLAAIVEKETNQNQEKRRMAGVYVNRLEKGIPLQADPTCVFATRDFTARRVLNRHIEFDSPYNTYMYAGLPPGPIAMSSIASIDGVLNREKHDYIFFCSKGDETGLHNYAKTMRGHSRNIAIYTKNLKKRGLR